MGLTGHRQHPRSGRGLSLDGVNGWMSHAAELDLFLEPFGSRVNEKSVEVVPDRSSSCAIPPLLVEDQVSTWLPRSNREVRGDVDGSKCFDFFTRVGKASFTVVRAVARFSAVTLVASCREH